MLAKNFTITDSSFSMHVLHDEKKPCAAINSPKPLVVLCNLSTVSSPDLLRCIAERSDDGITLA
jgi:hypothetical protein